MGTRDNHEATCQGKLECPTCKKSFKFKCRLDHHKCQVKKAIEMKAKWQASREKTPEPEKVVERKRHPCSKCGKRFSNPQIRQQHQETCKTKVICLKCNRTFLSVRGLEKHICSKRKLVRKWKRSNFQCKKCTKSFKNRSELYYHFLHTHTQTGRGYQDMPFDDLDAPWMEDGVLRDPELKDVYMKYKHLILRKSYAENNSQCNRNFPLDNSFTLEQLMEHAVELYKEQKMCFKLNLCFGFILKHKTTGEYRYYIPYTNEPVLPSPVYILKFTDLMRLGRRLSKLDITQYLQNRRPDSQWVPHLVTNVTFFLTYSQYPLGAPVELPPHLVEKRSLLCLTKSRSGYHVYDDNMCLFRCLAAHKHPHKYRNHDEFEDQVSYYYDRYREKCQEEDDEVPESQDDYEGFQIGMLPVFEKVFQINLEIYELNEDDVAQPCYKSSRRYKNTMYLNLYENHLSLILKMDAYAKKFQCRNCRRLFSHRNDCRKHEPRCKSNTRIKYPGGYYEYPKTIFEQLVEYGICVPPQDRFCDHFTVFDFESFLEPIDDDATDKLSWLQRHRAISVSVCSSLEGFTEPKCFVDEDEDQLIMTMLEHLSEIQSQYQAAANQKWGWALRELELLIEQWSPTESNDAEMLESDSESDDESADEKKEGFAQTVQKTMLKKLKALEHQLRQYMNQLLVIGFNRYIHSTFFAFLKFVPLATIYINVTQTAIINNIMSDTLSAPDMTHPW